MKSLMYIFMVIVFFNISIFSFYYFGTINHYSFNIFNNPIDILITNMIIISILILYGLIYIKYLISKFNYFTTMIVGLILGIIISLCIPNLIFEEYLYICLFSSFSLTFISYSIYFSSIKDKVFK